MAEQLYFRRRSNGVGSTIGSDIRIGALPGNPIASFAQPEYKQSQVGGINRWEITVPVIPIEPSNLDLELMRDTINGYVSQLMSDCDFLSSEVKNLPNGKVFLPFRSQCRGDLIIVNPTDSRVIATNVLLADVRISDDDLMMHGGMFVRLVFIGEAVQAAPSQRWCSFRIKANGTGSQLSQTNLVNNGLQSSRWTTFERESDGILQRVIVSTWYSSEAGARALGTIFAYADSQKAAMGFAAPQLKSNHNGFGKFLNTRNNFGDLTLDASHGGSSSTVLLENCTLEDVRIGESDEAGGVQIQYSFVNVRPEFQPQSNYWRFVIRANGTGSVTDTINLTQNTPEASWLWDFAYGAGSSDRIVQASVKVWIPNPANTLTLFDVQKKGETLKGQLKYRTPVIHQLPRGLAVMPNIFGNFGDLEFANTYNGSPTIVLNNCTLLNPPQAFDSLNESGVGLEFSFGRVSDTSQIS